jgi:DNA segregation ATPase FtsK/SpoIIIE, S-DNA-T family
MGIDYDSVEFFLSDLSRALTIGISGRSEDTQARLLTLILEYCQNHASDCPVEGYIIDDYDKKLQPFSTAEFVRKYSVEINDFEAVLHEMEETLQSRKEKVRESGISVLSGEPLLLCVIRNSNAFSEGVVSEETVDLYKRIIKDYRQFKVLFVFGSIENASIPYSAPDMLKCMKELRYLFICEDLSKIKIVDVSMNLLRRFSKPIEEGDCYVITGEDNAARLKVIQN